MDLRSMFPGLLSGMSAPQMPQMPQAMQQQQPMAFQPPVASPFPEGLTNQFRGISQFPSMPPSFPFAPGGGGGFNYGQYAVNNFPGVGDNFGTGGTTGGDDGRHPLADWWRDR